MFVSPPWTHTTITGGSSISFVATKHVFCCDKSMLVATKVLSRQNYVCRDKHNFVATKLLCACELSVNCSTEFLLCNADLRFQVNQSLFIFGYRLVVKRQNVPAVKSCSSLNFPFRNSFVLDISSVIVRCSVRI